MPFQKFRFIYNIIVFSYINCRFNYHLFFFFNWINDYFKL